MILRPVRPASPTGPPITNLPVGLMWYLVPLCSHFSGSTGLRMCSRTASIRSFCLMSGSCWVDRTSIDGHRLAVFVTQGDLALGIRAQPFELALLAYLGLLLDQDRKSTRLNSSH